MKRLVSVFLVILYSCSCWGVQSDKLGLTLQKSSSNDVEMQAVENTAFSDQEENHTTGNRCIGLHKRAKVLCEQMYYGIPCGILAVVLTIVIVSIWAK